MVYRKAWEVAYQRDRAQGRTRYADAEPTRVRLAELAAAHVPIRALSRAAGLSHAAVAAILAGDRSQVQQRTADRVKQMSLSDVYSDQAVGHVPKVGAVRRVQGLMAMGWSHQAMGEAGVANTARLLAAPGHLVTVERWREVTAAYARLSMTVGPSPETRGWARALGYAPPLAWDEGAIDDPTARPRGEAYKGPGAQVVDMVAVRRLLEGGPRGAGLNRDEQALAARALATRGELDAQIADRLGVCDRTVLRWRHRDGIPSPRSSRPSTFDVELDWAVATAATGSRAAARGERARH